MNAPSLEKVLRIPERKVESLLLTLEKILCMMQQLWARRNRLLKCFLNEFSEEAIEILMPADIDQNDSN